MPRFAIVADRYIYLSSVGLAFIVSYYFTAFYSKLKHGRKYLFVVLICYFIYLGLYVNVRARVWSNSETLKREVRELVDQREKDFK